MTRRSTPLARLFHVNTWPLRPMEARRPAETLQADWTGGRNKKRTARSSICCRTLSLLASLSLSSLLLSLHPSRSDCAPPRRGYAKGCGQTVPERAGGGNCMHSARVTSRNGSARLYTLRKFLRIRAAVFEDAIVDRVKKQGKENATYISEQHCFFLSRNTAISLRG